MAPIMQFRASSSSDSPSFALGQVSTDNCGFGQLGDSDFTGNNPMSGAMVVGSQGAVLSLNPITAINLGLQSTSVVASQAANYAANLPLGQLGLSHRLTEVRKAVVTPHGVRVHAVMDFDLTPRQLDLASNYEVSPANPMPVSRFLGAQSTRDRVLFQNNSTSQQYESPAVNGWVFENVPNNLMSDRPEIPEIQEIPRSFDCCAYPPPPVNRVLRINDLIGSNSKAPAWDLWSPTQTTRVPYLQKHVVAGESSGSRPEWKPLEPTIGVSGSSQRKPSGLMIIGSGSHRSRQLLENRVLALAPLTTRDQETADSEETVEENDGYDGKTHSLTRRKYGPYTCPRCRKVFGLSQSFASHIKTHYRSETMAERARRQRAKHRRHGGYRLAQSRQGLTVVPLAAIRPRSGPGMARGPRRNAGPRVGAGAAVKEKREEEVQSRENYPKPIPPPPGFPMPLSQIPPPPGMMPVPLDNAPLPPAVKAEIENHY